MFKRRRSESGQSLGDGDDDHGSLGKGEFPKASADMMADRRIVSAQPSRKDQFVRHMKALNESFVSWVKSMDKKDASVMEACQDYITYCEDLKQRYLRTFGEVLTFGSGDCGQLAHGIEEDNDLMVKYPRIVYSLRDKQVCGIACGGLHNAVYTSTGQVYTWGCGDDGSLGRPGEESMPLLVQGLSQVVAIGVACGDGQTLVLTSTGDVWGWGCYKDKEGNKWFNPDSKSSQPWKDIKKQQNVPLLIDGLKGIVEIACGSSFNLARSDDGEVYSWGIGECGELGREAIDLKPTRNGVEEKLYTSVLNSHIRPNPMYLKGKSREKVNQVIALGAGSYHAMVVVVGGKVLTTGLNNYSQLGTGGQENQTYLTPVDSLARYNITSVKGGMHHSLALTNDGKILAWGRSDYCQLGTSATDGATSEAGSFSSVPVMPLMPDDIIISEISCGGNHNLAMGRSKSNEKAPPVVYTWGYGEMLALGHGKDSDESTPRKIDFSKGAKIPNIVVTQVAGGGQHSAIIGQVLSA